MVTKSTMVREAIKAVCGEERYAKFAIYVDKRSNDKVRVKVQERWAQDITVDEAQEIVEYVRTHYDTKVTVTAGSSGSRMLHYTAFLL